jgi:hypothetical protein
MESNSYSDNYSSLINKPIAFIKNNFSFPYCHYFTENNNTIDDHKEYTNWKQFEFRKLFPNLINFLSEFDIQISENFKNHFEKEPYLYTDDESFYKHVFSKELYVKLARSHVRDCFDIRNKEYENITIYNKELDKVLNGQWIRLLKVHPYSCEHTIVCMMLMYIDVINRSSLIPEYDQNILLYSMLLHDISKYIHLNENLKEDFGGEVKRYNYLYLHLVQINCILLNLQPLLYQFSGTLVSFRIRPKKWKIC